MCMKCFKEVECVNGFVYVLVFVFCVCLTAAVLSGLFANMTADMNADKT